MNNKKQVCPICGEPTYLVYGKNPRKDGLCYKHSQMLFNKEIEQCENCGKWKNVNEKCSCQQKTKLKFLTKKVEFTSKKIEDEKQNDTDLTCIICGKPSNGKHFCLDCYYKYKDKSIDIRITNCNSTLVLDEYGNKTKRTKDGRLVRSLSEKIIIDYFFDNFIRVVYEKTIPYINEKGEEKELHPDFYLTDYDLYVEFNGLSNKDYLKKKNYASKIYKEKGFNVEILESADIDEIETNIQKILMRYKRK